MSDQRLYTVHVTVDPDGGDLAWAASVHRQLGHLEGSPTIEAVAGPSAHDVMIQVARILDKVDAAVPA